MVLQCLFGSQKRIELSDDFIATFGRDAEADITINSRDVSRQHGEFYMDQGVLYIRDLGSKNGIQINGLSAEDPHPLQDGDIISLGAVRAFGVSEGVGHAVTENAHGGLSAPDDIPEDELLGQDEALALRSADTMVMPQVKIPAVEEKNKISPVLIGVAAITLICVVWALLKSGSEPVEERAPYGEKKYLEAVDLAVVLFKKKNYSEIDGVLEEPLEKYAQNHAAHILTSMARLWRSRGDRYETFNWRAAEDLARELINVHPIPHSAQSLAENILLWLKREEPAMAKVQNILHDYRKGAGDAAFLALHEIPTGSKFKILYSTELGEVSDTFLARHSKAQEEAIANHDWDGALGELEMLRFLLAPSDVTQAQEKYRRYKKDYASLRSGQTHLDAQRYSLVEAHMVRIQEDSPYYSDAQKVLRESQEGIERGIFDELYTSGSGTKALAYAREHFSTDTSLIEKVEIVLRLHAQSEAIMAENKPEKVVLVCEKIIELEDDSSNYFHRKALRKIHQWSDPTQLGENYIARGKEVLAKGDAKGARAYFNKANILDETIGLEEIKGLVRRGSMMYNKAVAAHAKGDAKLAKAYSRSALDCLTSNDRTYFRIVDLLAKVNAEAKGKRE